MYPTHHDTLIKKLSERVFNKELNLQNFITSDYLLSRHKCLAALHDFLDSYTGEIISIDFTGCNLSRSTKIIKNPTIQQAPPRLFEDNSMNILVATERLNEWHEQVEKETEEVAIFLRNQEPLMPHVMALLRKITCQKLIFRGNQIDEMDILPLCEMLSELPLTELVFDHPKADLGQDALIHLIEKQVFSFKAITVGSTALQEKLDEHVEKIQLLNPGRLRQKAYEAIDQQNSDWLIRLFYHHLLDPDVALLNWDDRCVPKEYRDNRERLLTVWKKQSCLFTSKELERFLLYTLEQQSVCAQCIGVFFKLADPAPVILLFQELTDMPKEPLYSEVSNASIQAWHSQMIDFGDQIAVPSAEQLKVGLEHISVVFDRYLKTLQERNTYTKLILQTLFLLSNLAHRKKEYVSYVGQMMQLMQASKDIDRISITNDMLNIALSARRGLLQRSTLHDSMQQGIMTVREALLQKIEEDFNNLRQIAELAVTQRQIESKQHKEDLQEQERKYVRQLLQKDEQYTTQLVEKGQQYATQLAEKDQELVEKGQQYATQLAEKDQQYAAQLAEKDKALKMMQAEQERLKAALQKQQAEDVRIESCSSHLFAH